MTLLRSRCGGLHTLPTVRNRLFAVLLAASAAAGCDYPFEPYEQNDEGAFSLFGFLDLRADTQWVRVTEVRQNVQTGAEPIDAMVTLEHVASGRTVTLRDSVSTFPDPGLGGVGYAHNFWTTEPLEPAATYRLTATRSDGASTTALVEMPPAFEFTLHNWGRSNSLFEVKAERILSVDLFYAMTDSTSSRINHIIRGGAVIAPDGPGMFNMFLDGSEVEIPELLDLRRVEVRLSVAGADWPWDGELSDLDVRLPGVMPSNVDNGLGFVGGVATWTIPLVLCELVPPPADSNLGCATPYDAQSATISGRVLAGPCGEPHAFRDINLTEQVTPETATRRWWKTGWNGEYRFEGVTPGVGLVLTVPGAPPVHLPPLQPGERLDLDDIFVTTGC